jgi:predicted transposase YdaD
LGNSQPSPLQRCLKHDVTWVDLSALARRRDLDPALALLTLPVRQEQELAPCSQRILALRPDLIELILPILSERFQGLTSSQIMATLGISKDFWRHTRAFQDILAEGRQKGRRMEALNLEQMEALALDVLDFRNGEDLAAWPEWQERVTLVLEQPETIK